MKNKIISSSLLVTGFLLGATALSALAGVWTPPQSAPPADNVPAPINVGKLGVSALQEKFDSLMIDGNLGVLGNLVVATGTTAGSVQNMVLTAVDAGGTVGWRSVSGGGGSLIFSTEQTVQSTTATPVSVDLGPTATYDGCFITNIDITEGNEWQGGKCQITQSSGIWQLSAQGNGRPADITQCSARCIGQ